MHKENDAAHSHLRNEGERMEMGAFPSQHVLITQTVAHSIAYVYKEYVVYIICIVVYIRQFGVGESRPHWWLA